MAGYLGSVLLFFMAYVVGLFLVLQGRQALANAAGSDRRPLHPVRPVAFDWTPIEKSTRLIALEGTVLTNRLLWLGVALGALALTYVRFRFAHRTESALVGSRLRVVAPLRTGAQRAHAPPTGIGVTAPAAQLRRTPARAAGRRRVGFALHARQTLAIAWTSFRTIATSWAGLALLVAIPLLTVLVVLDQMALNGVPLVPTTARVLSELTAPLSAELSRWVIIPLLIVFFAGELVWREREAGLGEITDAMPGSEWVPFLGKFLGLGLVLVVFMALLMAAGMLAQVHPGLSGVRDRAVPANPLRASAPRIPPLRAARPRGARAGEPEVHRPPGGDPRLRSSSLSPPWSGSSTTCSSTARVRGGRYTEMRGFGPSLGPWLWFKLYWAAWALLLAVVARLLWVRGRESGLRGAAPAGAPSVHARHGLDWRGGGGAHPHAGRLHLLQHQRAERVPHRRRHGGAGAPSTSGATGSTRASRSPS